MCEGGSIIQTVSILGDFLKKNEIWVQVILIAIAAVFLSYDITRPLVDWDEATYAKVVVDTLQSGDLTTLQLSGNNWFYKPPLYFWMAMGSVKVFGATEFAFRLPTIALPLLVLWLVYLIVRELTDDYLTASLTFLVLLTSSLFLIFAREARTDQGMILGIVAALFFCIKGWKNPTYLFWLFPSIAVGFLFKSIVVFLAFPAILLYAFFYGQWGWIKSRYLWMGSLLSLAIVVPWHLLETIRFGWQFWDRYVGGEVFNRVVSNYAGSQNSFNYFELLPFYKPWAFVLIIETLAIIGIVFSIKLRSKIDIGSLSAPLLTAGVIIGLFSAANTHLTTYLMPAFPFLAMYVALSYRYLLGLIKNRAVHISAVLVSVLLVSFYVPSSVMSALNQVPGATFDERRIGQILKENVNGVPYIVDWPMLETIPYYGNTQLTYLDSKHDTGKLLRAPFYLIINSLDQSFFFRDPATPLHEGFKIVYVGKFLTMFHVDKDISFPPFK